MTQLLWLWHISCLCCSNPSKINKGLVNHQVLGDWQVWEAVDEEGMPVLPRCRGWGERANHSGGRAGKLDGGALAKKQERKRRESGRGDGNISETPAPSLFPLLPPLIPPSPSNREPALSHGDHTPHCCHGERGEEKRSDCSWIWGSFEEHKQAKQRQAPFSDYAREPKSSPSLSLSPHAPSPSTQQLNQ